MKNGVHNSYVCVVKVSLECFWWLRVGFEDFVQNFPLKIDFTEYSDCTEPFDHRVWCKVQNFSIIQNLGVKNSKVLQII